jgi:transposase
LTHQFRKWRNLSALGGVAYSAHGRRARVFLMFVQEAVRSPHVIRFLKHMRRHISGPVIVIWDGINPHRSLQTQAFIHQQRSWLAVIRLPAYAPELNPVEGLWSWFKGTAVPNLCPEGLDPIKRELRLGRRRLLRRSRVLLGFLHKAGLFF